MALVLAGRLCTRTCGTQPCVADRSRVVSKFRTLCSVGRCSARCWPIVHNLDPLGLPLDPSYLQPRACPRVSTAPGWVAGAPGIRETSFLAHLPEPAARAIDRIKRAIHVELNSGSEMGGVQAKWLVSAA